MNCNSTLNDLKKYVVFMNPVCAQYTWYFCYIFQNKFNH